MKVRVAMGEGEVAMGDVEVAMAVCWITAGIGHFSINFATCPGDFVHEQ